MLTVEPGVGGRHQPGAEHRGHGAGQPPAATDVEIDVDGAHRIGPQR